MIFITLIKNLNDNKICMIVKNELVRIKTNT